MLSTCYSHSEEQTEALGRRLGARLFPGAFLALWGDLGAGKTALCRGIGAALGAQDVASPTFTIVREHTEGSLPLYHFDVYRLQSADELYDIGFADYLAQNGAIVMEWPGNVADALPAGRLDIHIEGCGDAVRKITLRAQGEGHAPLLEALREGTE